jgi:hypothetical protein
LHAWCEGRGVVVNGSEDMLRGLPSGFTISLPSLCFHQSQCPRWRSTHSWNRPSVGWACSARSEYRRARASIR